MPFPPPSPYSVRDLINAKTPPSYPFPLPGQFGLCLGLDRHSINVAFAFTLTLPIVFITVAVAVAIILQCKVEDARILHCKSLQLPEFPCVGC